ncbi:TPA: hypothetical protein RQN23_002875 [Aeromonas veronii]|nr:hypothetical protein [Aeromonas veronii]
MAFPNFGVVFFDNPDNPCQGSASEAGQAVFSITSIGDLKSDVIWITNLEFDQIRAKRLWNNPKIKRINFFRDDLYKISKELGLVINSSNVEGLRVLSEIVNRVMQMAFKHYSIEEVLQSFKDTINKSLMTPLYHLDDGGSGNLLLDQILNESFNAYQQCYGEIPQDYITASLKFSRFTYGQEILDMPVPCGAWNELKDYPKGWGVRGVISADSPVDYLNSFMDEKPMLVNLVTKNMDSGFAELLDFANGTNRRQWVTAQEAVLAGLYGDIQIKGIYIAEGYQKISEKMAFALPNEGITAELSISLGILAENHWTSLASGRKVNIHGVVKDIKPARAVWMRSWDRIMCWKAAQALKQAGYLVRGYGVGGVDVAVLPARLGPLYEFAASLSLSSPLWILKKYEEYLSLLALEDGEEGSGGPSEQLRRKV